MVSEDSWDAEFDRCVEPTKVSQRPRVPSFLLMTPHRSHCHQPLMMSGRVVPDTRTSQHIARFYNGLKP
ncbi:hypothetical protein GBAR_LOCUS3978, partial [Geodia barretti]